MSDTSVHDPGQPLAGAERLIYAGAELRLIQLDVDLPDGDRIWWDAVRLLRTVSVALIDDDDRVLLQHRSRLIQGRSGWELPGGIVDDDEDPRDAAIRELTEIAGYRAGQLTLAQSLQPAPHSVDGERLLFVGRDPRRLADSGAAGDRQEWLTAAAIRERIQAGQIWDSATLVALLGIQAQAW